MEDRKNSAPDAVPKAGSLKLSEADYNRIHALVDERLASGEMERYSFIAAEDGKKD